MFRDREEAGCGLAEKLARYRGRADTVVLGVARGGVVVASQVSRALGLPLDVFISQRLRLPGEPNRTYGAVTEYGNVHVDPARLAAIGVTAKEQARELRVQRQEVLWRKRLFRGGRPLPPLHGRVVVLIDDGIASGATLTAAIEALRRLAAARVVLASPVGPLPVILRLAGMADEFEVIHAPKTVSREGRHYERFEAVSSGTVIAGLSAGHLPRSVPALP